MEKKLTNISALIASTMTFSSSTGRDLRNFVEKRTFEGFQEPTQLRWTCWTKLVYLMIEAQSLLIRPINEQQARALHP